MAKPRPQRTLRDLKLVGRAVTFDDEHGEPMVVWMQKLNPADHAVAVKKANAARARLRVAYKDHDSDEWMALSDIFEDLLVGDALIDLVIAEDVTKLHASVQAEIELAVNDGEPTEWGDGYLQGLRDEWNDHASEAYMEDENDPGARRILEEFKRFNDQVEAAVRPQVDQMRAQHQDVPEDVLRERALDKLTRHECDTAWSTEFQRCEIWLATRKACDLCKAGDDHVFVHDDFYFQNRSDIDELHESILAALFTHYHELVTDVVEGKESPPRAASSSSSGSPESEGTAEDSGQETAA